MLYSSLVVCFDFNFYQDLSKVWWSLVLANHNLSMVNRSLCPLTDTPIYQRGGQKFPWREYFGWYWTRQTNKHPLFLYLGL